ncbi:MAG: outer membrane beta-barrel protein [Saprospiraceae bacterium]|nr:outer membrane beta-barrel protein [Saprospiraceae bacterium]
MRYRKRLFILYIFILLVSAAKAQMRIGVSGGGGLDGTVSIRAAIPIEIPINKALSIQSGVVFQKRHNPQLLPGLGYEHDYRQPTIAYLGIPVLLKARLDMHSFWAYVLTGPQVDYGLSFSATYFEDGFFGYEKLDFETFQVARLDFGMNIGAGFEKEISNNCKIFAELLLTFNFRDIDKSATYEVFNESRIFNLGFLLPLHR